LNATYWKSPRSVFAGVVVEQVRDPGRGGGGLGRGIVVDLFGDDPLGGDGRAQRPAEQQRVLADDARVVGRVQRLRMADQVCVDATIRPATTISVHTAATVLEVEIRPSVPINTPRPPDAVADLFGRIDAHARSLDTWTWLHSHDP
jgi:hypothetical protein